MQDTLISTGVAGLDEILRGGLPQTHTYLLTGAAGTGKTTLSFQFLLEGVRRQEKVLYLTLIQPEKDIRKIAASHGWDLTGVEIRSFVPQAIRELRTVEQDILPRSELQLNEVMAAIQKAIQEVRPARLVFDSVEQLRGLSGDDILYQEKMLTLQAYLAELDVTAILVESAEQKPEFKTLVHGVITLGLTLPSYGDFRRYISIEKMRGMAFSGGHHAFSIRYGGIEVYPRLPLSAEREGRQFPVLESGIAELDTMLGGGLKGGTTCLLEGDSGTGKSSLSAKFAHAAAKRGEHVAIFLFEERQGTYLDRTSGLGMDLSSFIEQGLITFHQIKIGDLSAGELAQRVRNSVERKKTKLVIFDSLTGVHQAIPQEPLLMAQLHEMLAYLGQEGVLSLMISTEHGLFSGRRRSDVDASFIADAVLLLRWFEAEGEFRLSLSAIKKRYGSHEKTIRELQITSEGIKVGRPLKEFRGIMTGNPTYTGKSQKLMD